jgi:hypothetical protein
VNPAAVVRPFLGILFGGELAGLFLLVWLKRGPKKVSRFFQDLDEASAFAAQASARGSDVYFGCALSPRDFGAHLRCPADKVAGIPGVFMDVDYAHPVHEKQNLPPVAAAVLNFLDELPLRPTLIVDSGHGLHVWWLFVKTWVLDSDEERQRAAALVQTFQAFVRQRMAARGWAADSTHDLARVLRPAGTLNYKVATMPVPVTIIREGGPRYDSSDFEEWAAAVPPAAAAPASSLAGVAARDLLLEPGRPLSAKLEALLENEPLFAGAFARTRASLASDSECDFAIASWAIRVGCTDQEIANAIALSRNLHGRKPDAAKKRLRLDYLNRTVARARALSLSSRNRPTMTWAEAERIVGNVKALLS